jgi:hypothetical protein
MLRPFSTAAGFDFLTAGISREDFRRASDISGDVQADTALMQMNQVQLKPKGRSVQSWRFLCLCAGDGLLI